MSAATITIHVPRALRAYCDGASELAVACSTVRGALDELERRFPGVYGEVNNPSIRSFITSNTGAA